MSRILSLSWWNPYPPDIGARLRVLSFVTALASRPQHQIDLLAFAETEQEISAAREGLGILGVSARFVPHPIHEVSRREQLAHRLAAALRTRPYAAQISNCQPMRLEVQAALRNVRYDVVIAETSWMGQYVRDAQDVRRLLSWQNVDFDVYAKRFKSERNPLVRMLRAYNYWTARRFEVELVRCFDSVITVTTADRDLLLRTVPDAPPVHVLPVSVNTKTCPFQIPREMVPPRLLFVGTMYYQPNVDAVLYFYNEIYGLIRTQVPDVHFVIVGKNPVEPVLKLAKTDPSVTVTGAVPDLGTYYRQASVMVAPTRYGGGMKTKIVEAMAFGVPVVATASALEGIAETDGEYALIRHTPVGFAQAVVRLLCKPDERRRLAIDARRLVEERFSWDAFGQQLDKIVEARSG